MTDLELFSAIGAADERYIDEALSVKRPNRVWLRIGASVAAMAILAVGVWLLARPASGVENCPADVKTDAVKPTEPARPSDERGVWIPKTEVTLKDGPNCMMGFFIHGGRSYVFYANSGGVPVPESLIGEKLGTSNGFIDVWTPKDGYVDGAGSVKGDYYAVEGYAPEFMLCMKRWVDYAVEDNDPESIYTKTLDGVELYVNDNDRAFYDGSNLFDELLHVPGRVDSVRWQTREEWYYSTGDYHPVDAAALDGFIETLCASPFVAWEDIPVPEGGNIINDLETHHVFLTLTDGLTVHLRVLRGGYVCFEGVSRAYVHIGDEAYGALVAALEG